MFDAERHLSFFAVVDARLMQRLATVWLRHALPQGLHGAFYPGVYLGMGEPGVAKLGEVAAGRSRPSDSGVGARFAR